MIQWKIEYEGYADIVTARNPGAAVHKYLKNLRTTKNGKKPKVKTPRTTNEGGWENLVVEPLNGWKYGVIK